MTRTVLWGGRRDDVQLGSRADRQRQARLRGQYLHFRIEVEGERFLRQMNALGEQMGKALTEAVLKATADLRAHR